MHCIFNSWKALNGSPQDSLAFALGNLLGSRLVQKELLSIYPVELLLLCLAVEGSAQHRWHGLRQIKVGCSSESRDMDSRAAAASGGVLEKVPGRNIFMV